VDDGPVTIVTAAEVGRELERVADRLRAFGPRLAGRAEPLARVRVALQHLADLTADAEGRARRPVPELPAHALADQLLVLGHDALGAPGVTPDAVRSDLEGLRRVL
jgi:hypothetical protein